MIVGVGVDLVEVKRMASLYDRFGRRCFHHILGPGEQAEIPRTVALYLAGRFAAKEATVKALGTGFSGGIVPPQVEVLHGDGGRPVLVLHGAALRRAEALGVTASHVSLSHEREHALAFVILEGGD